MSQPAFSGVIAAIATAVGADGEPDCARSTALAKFLLENGCDGLNVLGTTGEATSFSSEQRRRMMTAYREAGVPMERLMVGTGAAAASDAVALTRHAAELGFAGALVLPPFYYKGVADEGLLAYLDAIVTSTEHRPIPIYLYHFPAMSGVPWHVGLIARIRSRFGSRIAPSGPFDARSHVGVHQYGEIGHEAAAKNTVQFENRLTAEFSAAALVGFAGIGEAVAENNFAPCQRR